ncbi:MAG: molybdate ABC transporter substrate-binding protein [Acuticoccus sp.]
MRRVLAVLVLGAVGLVPLPAPASAANTLVFAAASLKTALDDVIDAFAEASGHTVVASYAGSSSLARQILAGAPADLFISANTQWMDAVEEAGLVVPQSRRDLLGNRLVLVAPGEAAPVTLDAAFVARLGADRLAMAFVDAVPAGIYGKAALTALGLWPQVAARVAEADNVRAALALVARGEAPFGIVYATDAAAEPRVSIAASFPEESHPSIVYPAALLGDGAVAAEFLAFLESDTARALFERQGFATLAP